MKGGINILINAKLISWNASTGELTYSVEGVQRTSTVVSTTTPHRAPINRFVPTDPILPIVLRWNAPIRGIKGRVFFGDTNPPTDNPNTYSRITTDLAAAGANMAIHLKPNSDIVAALHPIPFIPPNPV